MNDTKARGTYAYIMPLVTLAAVLLLLRVPPLHADVIVDIYQSGSNVVSSYSGTINLTDLTAYGPDGVTAPYVWGAEAVEVFGPTVGGLPVYSGITGPADLGTGLATDASSSTGDTFGYAGADQLLLLPTGYTSGSSISGTDTWDDTTLASLGLTPGTYTYTWGTGADADSITVDIGTVPEPGTLCMFLSGLLGAGLLV